MSASPDYLSRTEIGSHVVTAERDGILHLVVRGSISEAEAVAFKDAMVEHGKQHPDYPFIVDVSQMAGISGGARRALVIQDRRYAFGCCYIVGASFAVRVLITSIYRARRVLQPDAIVGSTMLPNSEEEARRLIAARQQQQRAR